MRDFKRERESVIDLVREGLRDQVRENWGREFKRERERVWEWVRESLRVRAIEFERDKTFERKFEND